MTVNQRIREFQKILKISQREFSNNIGVNETTISSIYEDKNLPNLKVIIAIITHYPNLDARWLMLGEGSMFKKSNYSEKIGVCEPPAEYKRIESVSKKNGIIEDMERRIAELESIVKGNYTSASIQKTS
jgi:DNA-binding XRE family transcriptional regulator